MQKIVTKPKVKFKLNMLIFVKILFLFNSRDKANQYECCDANLLKQYLKWKKNV